MKTPTNRARNPQENSPQRFNHMCVCQICTCGKHVCCPEGTHKPFIGQTTYNTDYKACPGIINQLRRSERPCTTHYHQRRYDPGLLKTTYDTQYTPHKIESHPIDPNQKYQYRPRTGKFYDDTQYKNSYTPKQVPRDADRGNRDCVQPYVPRKAKFDGTTTYNSEYSPKKAERAFNPAQSPYTYQRKKVPFDGKTTYNTEYKPHKIQPSSRGCCDKCGNGCRCGYVPRTTPFQGQSHYKANYKPYQIQRDQHHCPVLDLPPYPRKCPPGKCHVSYSAEKNKWQ